MNERIMDIYKLLQEIAWCFGSHGINGECCGELSMTEFIALRKIGENKNFSIQEIGNSINFTKSGATRIVDRLENKGYVIRERSALDYRVCCITVTPKGKTVITEAMEKYSVYLDEILKDLGKQDIDNIQNALAILVESINRHKFV